MQSLRMMYRAMAYQGQNDELVEHASAMLIQSNVRRHRCHASLIRSRAAACTIQSAWRTNGSRSSFSTATPCTPLVVYTSSRTLSLVCLLALSCAYFCASMRGMSVGTRFCGEPCTSRTIGVGPVSLIKENITANHPWVLPLTGFNAATSVEGGIRVAASRDTSKVVLASSKLSLTALLSSSASGAKAALPAVSRPRPSATSMMPPLRHMCKEDQMGGMAHEGSSTGHVALQTTRSHWRELRKRSGRWIALKSAQLLPTARSLSAAVGRHLGAQLSTLKEQLLVWAALALCAARHLNPFGRSSNDEAIFNQWCASIEYTNRV